LDEPVAVDAKRSAGRSVHLTDTQKAFLLQAAERLAAAEILRERGLHRVAVSNAYFAMFYTAEAFLEGKGLSFSKHAAVIAAFGREFAKTGELPAELHRFLIDASEDRAEADYVATSEITEDEVDVRINQARRFLDIARDRLGTP
jgi:uncharacterized protein (UPF0332 family)